MTNLFLRWDIVTACLRASVFFSLFIVVRWGNKWANYGHSNTEITFQFVYFHVDFIPNNLIFIKQIDHLQIATVEISKKKTTKKKAKDNQLSGVLLFCCFFFYLFFLIRFSTKFQYVLVSYLCLLICLIGWEWECSI